MTVMQQRVAVKIVLVNDKGQVLLLRKSQDNERHAGNSGLWNLPGGKINPGESIYEALVREAFEEVGVKVHEYDPAPIYAGEWRPVVRGQQLQIVGLFYVCQHWSGEIVIDSEHDDYRWIERHSLTEFSILPPEDLAVEAFYKKQ